MKKADLIIIFAAFVMLFAAFFGRSDGETVKIYINGELYREAALNKDSTIHVKSRYGENTVTVKNGCAAVCDADCPDKLCEKTVISKGGQCIVCLPNRLSVVIEGKNETDVIV